MVYVLERTKLEVGPVVMPEVGGRASRPERLSSAKDQAAEHVTGDDGTGCSARPCDPIFVVRLSFALIESRCRARCYFQAACGRQKCSAGVGGEQQRRIVT